MLKPRHKKFARDAQLVNPDAIRSFVKRQLDKAGAAGGKAEFEQAVRTLLHSLQNSIPQGQIAIEPMRLLIRMINEAQADWRVLIDQDDNNETLTWSVIPAAQWLTQTSKGAGQ